MKHTYRDIMGIDVSVGDRIIYAPRNSRHSVLKIGTVVELGEPAYRPTLTLRTSNGNLATLSSAAVYIIR